jgi:hypothetical protein
MRGQYTRRRFLGTAAGSLAATQLVGRRVDAGELFNDRRAEARTAVTQQAGGDATAIRPFQVNVPETELADLRSRINATKWPERETVTDDSQGVPLAMIQELARHWATSTFTSFTFGRSTRTRCRSSSTMDGPARSSSS